MTTLSTFVLAMTMFPEKQIPAQEELDRVLGRKRLPDFDDRESLPQITAILREVLRCVLYHVSGNDPDIPPGGTLPSLSVCNPRACAQF